MDFVHDFPTDKGWNEEHVEQNYIREDFLNYLDIVQEKYFRRIQRFREVLNGKNKIFLIRACRDVNRYQAEKLYELITERYPYSDITLVICSYYPDEPWNIPGVFNFYVPTNLDESKNKEWREIFEFLGLIKPHSSEE